MSAAAEARSLRLDRYHSGLRLTVLLGWAAGGLLIYIGGLALWWLAFADTQAWFWLPWTLGALFLSQFAGRWLEEQLLRRWPSGRTLEVAGARLTLRERTGAQTFDLTQTANFRRWRFRIQGRRSGRVPVGHYCCALQLMQTTDEAAGAVVASLYTFVPPSTAEAWQARWLFYELRRPKETEPRAVGAAGGRDAAFLAAEQTRWTLGAELEPADFEWLLQQLGAQLPNFSATPIS